MEFHARRLLRKSKTSNRTNTQHKRYVYPKVCQHLKEDNVVSQAYAYVQIFTFSIFSKRLQRIKSRV